jgi:hypothetical protein
MPELDRSGYLEATKEMTEGGPEYWLGGHLGAIFILGVDHFLQNLESNCMTVAGRESETTQKNSLRARLEELVSQRQPELIGEEAKLDRDCIGKEFAAAHRGRYCNLTMPWEERSKAGVNKDYDRTDATRKAAYQVFEAFMFHQIQKNRGTAKSVIVICGSYHVEGLGHLFRAAGDDVLTEDTYDAAWYRGIPLESDGEIVGFYKERHGRADRR